MSLASTFFSCGVANGGFAMHLDLDFMSVFGVGNSGLGSVLLFTYVCYVCCSFVCK